MNRKGPRERLWERGPRALDDCELLAVVLATGPRGADGHGFCAVQLAEALLGHFEGLGRVFGADLVELLQVRGIGPSKAALLMAIREIGNRLSTLPANPCRRVTNSLEAYRLFFDIAGEEQEVVVAAFLDARNQLIRKREIFRGTLLETVAQPREILREALKVNAASILIAHNHPSQDPEPSEEDARFTARVQWAASAIGISLVDHLVVCGGGRYFSFSDSKLLKKSESAYPTFAASSALL